MSGRPDGAALEGTAPSTQTGAFRFTLVGPFAAERDGAALPPAELASRKGRTLLKLLLIERGHLVPTERIVEVVWGQSPPVRAPRLVATLVSRLRSLLGSEAIAGGPDGYRLVTSGRVSVDVDEAARLVEEAEARLASEESSLAYTAAAGALEILQRGTVLEDEPYADWAAEARQSARRLLGRARRAGWDSLLALRDFGRAATVAQAALDDDPLDEAAGRALIRALHEAGKTGAALARYEELRALLAAELGVDPAPETRALHLAILRDEVLPARAARTRATAAPAAYDPAFIGRDEEVARLSALWAEAAAGTPRLVLVAGEAGIGKTRLAQQIVELANRTGGSCIQARCYEAERSLFLQPLADALRSVVLTMSPEVVRGISGEWAGTLSELVPEIGLVLRPLTYEKANPEFERRRAFQAMASVLRELANRRPLLVFLDDLHNAGSATIELLHFLAQRFTGARLMVLASVRVEEGGEALTNLGPAGTTLDLGPLPDAAVADLARAAGAEEAVQRILTLTKGHTLSVVESLRSFAEGGDIGAGSGPESLVTAVESRVARAGPQVEELLRVGSVLGSAFDPEIVARMLETPIEDVFRRAESARGARLLVAAGPLFEFANDLIREILYESTPQPVRTARHRRAASLMQGTPEAVAVHASAAQDWDVASRAWLEAGEHAVARYAMRDAQRLLDRALEAAAPASDPVVEARARHFRGRAREAMADFQGAVDDHSEAVALARETGAADVELRSLRELGGDTLVGLGRPIQECIPYLESALSLAIRLGDRSVQVEVLTRLVVIHANCLRFDQAYELSQRAVAVARELGDELVLALAFDGVKAASAYAGDLDTLRTVLPELEPILRRHQHLQQLQWAVFESSFLEMAAGRWPGALARIESAVEVSGRSGYQAYETLFLAHAAWVHRSSGDYGLALTTARRATAAALDLGHPWWQSFSEIVLGWLLTELGSFTEARGHLRRALEAAERDGAESYRVRALSHFALVESLDGDTNHAHDHLGRAVSLFKAITTPVGIAFLHGAHAYLAAARAALACGSLDVASRLVEAVREPAERFGWLETSADASLVAGICARAAGDTAAAETLVGRALQLLEGAELAVVGWQAHAEMAALHREAGRQAEADHHERAARTLVNALAATIGNEELEQSFRAAAAHKLHADF